MLCERWLRGCQQTHALPSITTQLSSFQHKLSSWASKLLIRSSTHSLSPSSALACSIHRSAAFYRSQEHSSHFRWFYLIFAPFWSTSRSFAWDQLTVRMFGCRPLSKTGCNLAFIAVESPLVQIPVVNGFSTGSTKQTESRRKLKGYTRGKFTLCFLLRWHKDLEAATSTDEEDKTHWNKPGSVESPVMLTVSSFPLACPECLEVGAVQVLVVVYQHLVSQQHTLHLWVGLFWSGYHGICSWLGNAKKVDTWFDLLFLKRCFHKINLVSSVQDWFSWLRDLYLISIFVDLYDIGFKDIL